MADQPTGTVTLLFTDIDGSTQLLQRLGTERYSEALDLHRRLLRDAFERHGGYEVDHEGDAFFVAFASASDAAAASAEAQRALTQADWPEGTPIRVRMGLHTGEPLAAPPKYVGLDVHKAARIMAAGHGGQVLVSATTEPLLTNAGLLPLGEHRLKDLVQPEPLFQLEIDGLPSEFPALNTLGNRPTNLPVQPSPIVGRGAEILELSERLCDPAVRLMTLTGPGGVGKTRLALQIAAENLEAFDSGVFFVPLAPVEDPALVLSSVAHTLALREQPGEELADTLGKYLERKQILILLDNFEHVVDAAPQLGALLERIPRLKLLATSRERLGLRAENAYEVPPLPATDAAELFVAHARRIDHRFQPGAEVNEIVRRLDGLPLALELAASRVKILTISQISQRLGHSLDFLEGGPRDAPERQRTLRATIRWSYALLADRERDSLNALSVFTGSFDLTAAEVVTGADLATLSSLVDKSLLRRTDTGRFFLLDTIRQFAFEELTRRGAVDHACEAHARHYLARVRESASPPHVPLDEEWGRTFLLEEQQLRTALTMFRNLSHARELQEMCALLWFTWDHFGRSAEGRARLEEALALEVDEPLRRARLVSGLSTIAWRQGDGVVSLAAARTEVSILRDLNDLRRLSDALRNLANAYYLLNDFAAVDRVLAESAELAQRLGDGASAARALVNRGGIALARGDDAKALELSLSGIELGLVHGQTEAAAIARHNCGTAQFRMGRIDDAEASFKASLLSYGDSPGPWMVLFPVDALAAVAARNGQFERAARLLGAVGRLRDETGVALDGPQLILHNEASAATEASLGTDDFTKASEIGANLSMEDLVHEALAP